VPTGLKENGPESVGRRDALRLLAMTEPLLDSITADSVGPLPYSVDLHVLKRTIIAVAQHAARSTPLFFNTRGFPISYLSIHFQNHG
jgi:hypothetical protein